MKMKVLGLLAAGLLIEPMAAHAVIQTTTLNNVTIGSSVYNVTFSQDSDGLTSFDDVFGAGSPVLTFTTQADALAAAIAVQAAADAINFDYTAAGLNNVFALAFAYTATDFSFYSGWSDDPQFNGVFGPFARSRTDGSNFTSAFATFALVPQGVPEPGSLALLGLGLTGLALTRRRNVP